MKTGQLVTKLIESLKRNLRWDTREFKNLDEQQKSQVLSFIQREQIMTHELLFSIAQEQNLAEGHVDIDVSHLWNFFQYLSTNDFSGRLICMTDHADNIRDQQRSLDALTDSQSIAQNKIRDLGIITFLAMLRIDVFQSWSSSSTATAKTSPEPSVEITSLI